MKIILRSPDGRFFEVEEDLVKEFEIKAEDLPQGALARQQQSMGGPNGAPGQGAGGGGPQIVIYTMAAGSQGPQGQPQGPQQGPQQGQPQRQSQEGDKGDVEPRQYGWVNYWNNWNNYWTNWGNWGNYWSNY